MELLLSAGKILLGVAVGPTLVVYLAQDRLIFILLPGASHNTSDGLPAFWQNINPFLQKS